LTDPILLVEDSPEVYEITLRAFRRSNVLNPFYRCQDGDEALDFLHHRAAYADPSKAPRPVLIFLDLNLPGTDRREVLAEIKKDDDLKEIPVVVLTTSSDENDIASCYRAGANSYVQKRVSLAELYASIQSLKEYWFALAELPRQE
jgi:CheY-like chemotaxis protein